MPVYVEREDCRVCGDKLGRPLVDLGEQYIPNFVAHRDDALPKAPLVLLECYGCGLLQLSVDVDPSLLWRNYWYRSSVNATMREALTEVVDDVLGDTSVPVGTWLDIGANDGYLLSRVPPEFSKIAVEPALNFAPLLEEHADHVVNDFFSVEAIEGKKADVITSCAMFYDVADPNRFVADIAATLTPNGVWVNQLSETTQMLRSTAFDNICHEHRCYYDVPALKSLYARHGLSIVSTKMNDVNGGSVRVMAMKTGSSNTLGVPRITVGLKSEFAARVERWKVLGQQLMQKVVSGRVWFYGASTKGSVLLQYLGAGYEHALGVADRNPAKHGLVMAGTWIPIVDEAAMRKNYPDYLVVLPWAFANEFSEREALTRASGTTIVFPLPDWRFAL